MKKISIPFLSLVLLMTACNKQESKVADVPEEAQMAADAKPTRQCASDEVLQQQIAKDPQRGRNLEMLELKTQAYKGGTESLLRAAGRLYVPVIVHVVLPNPAQVTDAQIQSQIDVLNADFNRQNSELQNQSIYLAGYNYNNVANCDIEFVVKGIVRKVGGTATFGSNDAVKKSSQGGSDAVNATTHMNMWVCDLSSGLLGYAQFPGGSASTDGVVIDYQAFGKNATYPMYSQFNLGRTATHEVGHWVNLRHIWGDRRCGDDFVGDTPAHDDANGGCPSTTHRSRCTGKPLEQWMNYMDYTDDRCMYMFSGGQKTRMDAAIDNSRAAYFLTSRP